MTRAGAALVRTITSIIGRTWMISVLKITNLLSKNLKFVIGGKLISELIA